MFQTLLLFLGYPAKKYVAGDVHAAQASSPHRVSNGQRRTRQLPKAKTRLSGGTGGPPSRRCCETWESADCNGRC